MRIQELIKTKWRNAALVEFREEILVERRKYFVLYNLHSVVNLCFSAAINVHLLFYLFIYLY